MSLKFCANLSFMFTENSNILERYGLAQKAGFKAVESAYPNNISIEKIVQAKNVSGVQQILLNMYVEEGQFGYAAIPGKEQIFKDSLNKTIKLAKALQCSKIHITAGTVQDDQVTEQHHETYEKNLIYASKILKNENIVGVIEPINRYSLPNYYLRDYDFAIKLITKIDSQYIRLQLDIFHLQLLRGDLTHSIQGMLPYTSHVQIAQAPNRGEPNTNGEINYKYVLALLEREKYNGWIGLEYKPANSTIIGLNWLSEYGFKL